MEEFVQGQLHFEAAPEMGVEDLQKTGIISSGRQSLRAQGVETPVTAEVYQQAFQHALWDDGSEYEESSSHRSNERRRVREQLAQVGSHSLSTTELLTIIMNTDAGKESPAQQLEALLTRYSLPELLRIDLSELSRQHLGEAKAAQFKALLEVARRLTLPSIERYKIASPADAANLVMQDMTFLDHEQLRVLVLDTKNSVAANLLMYQGTVNSSVVRVAELFRPAITRNCPGIIVCHNHPSGSVEPSPEDLTVTEQLVEAGKLLEIELVDHLIIGDHRFSSLKERLRW